jgi:hypothetical protein
VNKILLESDQFYNWSDQHERQIYQHVEAKTKNAPAKPARLDRRTAGFPHRALQALRQVWMQLLPGSGPRPQILSVRQQAETETRNGLCSARLFGKSERASGQLPQDKINPGRALRDQPRTPAPEGETLARSPPCSLRGQRDANVSSRCRRDGHSLCQYARRGAEKHTNPIGNQGGKS